MADDKKRAKITDENRREAASLLALWNASKSEHRTQAEFGEHYGLGNQANVGHYLHARSALNTKAALAFAQELKCEVGDFSHRLAQEIQRQRDALIVTNFDLVVEKAAETAQQAPVPVSVVDPTMGSGDFLLAAVAAIGRAIQAAPAETRSSTLRMLEEYFLNPAANEDMLEFIERRLLGEPHAAEPKLQANGK